LNNVRVNIYDIAISVGGDHYTGSGGASPARAGASDRKGMQMESKKGRKGEKGRRFFFASFALFAFFASTFLYLFAQQSRKEEVIRLGQEFDLKINQEVMIEGEGLAVAFESVLEDSRCPEGVDCLWSGNAKIRIRSSKQKQTPATTELNTDAGSKSSSYLNYEIRLVALKPRPKPDEAVRPHEYKAALIITKR
jgi:hypothetical protein